MPYWNHPNELQAVRQLKWRSQEAHTEQPSWWSIYVQESALEKMNQDGQMAFESMRGREGKLIGVFGHTQMSTTFTILREDKLAHLHLQVQQVLPKGTEGGKDFQSEITFFLSYNLIYSGPFQKDKTWSTRTPFFLFLTEPEWEGQSTSSDSNHRQQVITEHFFADEKGSRPSREIRSVSAGTGPGIRLPKAQLKKIPREWVWA